MSTKYTLFTIACRGRHKTGVKLEGYLKVLPKPDLQKLEINENIRHAWFSEDKASVKGVLKLLRESPWAKGPKWKCQFKMYRTYITYKLREVRR